MAKCIPLVTFFSNQCSILGVMDTQVLVFERRAKVPMHDLSRNIFPLVYYLLPPLTRLGLLKYSLWSSEYMLQVR